MFASSLLGRARKRPCLVVQSAWEARATVAHLGDYIPELGDLRPFQALGLEHAHSKRKVVCLAVTNRRPGQRTPQNMSHLVASEHTKREFKDTLDSREHEAQKRAKRVRALRHIKNVEDLHF